MHERGPGRYYYDDATGYEIYKPDDEEDDDDEEQVETNN
ncbi:MAG: hypothetical protein QOE33_15 [Acidobacteriota bacterium]|nr:hypothetical protein [Acidobacteriota bacterium]